MAAAAVVAATGVGGVVWDAMRDDPPGISQPADPVDQVLQAGDAERYTQRFADGSRATIVRSRELNRAVVLTQDMAPPPPGKTYELWLDHTDVGMVPAGTMDAGEDTLLLEGDPATAIGAGITVEPDGGSPTPSDEVVHVFTFDQA